MAKDSPVAVNDLVLGTVVQMAPADAAQATAKFPQRFTFSDPDPQIGDVQTDAPIISGPSGGGAGELLIKQLAKLGLVVDKTAAITPVWVFPGDSFDKAVAPLKLTTQYLFGTAARGAGPIIPIKNATDLAANFNAYEDFTGQQVINSELERYQPFTSSKNFVFSPDHLSLTATLDSGGKLTPQAYGQCAANLDLTPGNANTMATLGLTSTFGSMPVIFTPGGPWTGNNQTGYQNRDVYPAANLSPPSGVTPGFITVSFEVTAGTTSATLSGAYVGHQGAGGNLSFDGNQVQLLFAGATTLTGLGPGIYTSDPIAFTIDSTKNLVVSSLWAGTTVTPRQFIAGATGNTLYLSNTVTDPSVTTPTYPAGWSTTANLTQFVTSINFSLTAPPSLEVGQLVEIVYSGIYRISALVANTTISFTPFNGSPALVTSWAQRPLILYLPYYMATTNATITGTTFPVANMPVGVYAGMWISYRTSNNHLAWNGTARVLSTVPGASGSVTIDTSATLPTGTDIAFTPPIRSGQLWTKNQYVGNSASNIVLAIELTMQLPHSVSGPQYRQPYDNATLFAALPPGGAGGAWPAPLFIYSADDLKVSYRDTSEIDVEFYHSSTTDGRTWTGYTHGGSGAADFVKNPKPLGVGGVIAAGDYFWFNDDQNKAVHKIQLIWTNNELYRYWDGQLLQAQTWKWGSFCPAQIGIDLAVGSLEYYYAANLFVPYNDANLPYSLDLYSMKIWSPS
jgi:hypothetical protein